MNAVRAEWKRLKPFFALLDFEAWPRTKVGWIVRLTATLLAAWLLSKRVRETTAPLLHAKPTPTIPTEEIEDLRFGGLTEEKRRAIFARIAAGEIAERKRAIAANTWQGHQWSREDDRGWQERTLLRSLASEYKISLSQVFLILDEGIRAKWPGPDGEPLKGTTPALEPRTTW